MEAPSWVCPRVHVRVWLCVRVPAISHFPLSPTQPCKPLPLLSWCAPLWLRLELCLRTRCVLALLHCATSFKSCAAHQITSLPGWSQALPTKQYSGYLTFDGRKHIHYWFVESEVRVWWVCGFVPVLEAGLRAEQPIDRPCDCVVQRRPGMLVT